MLRFEVSGADRATGEDKVFTIDAPTERDAVLKAKEKNVLVSSVKLAQVAIPYAARLPEPARPHQGIVSAAKILTWFARGCYILGCVGFIGGLVLALLADRDSEAAAGNAFLAIFVPSLIGSCYTLCVGAVLQMLAAIGVAVREIAINSAKA